MKRVLSLLFVLTFLVSLSAFAAAEKQEITLEGSMGTLYGVLLNTEEGTPKPLVILAHGFGSSHRGVYDYAEDIAAQGYAAFVFDFCGGGNSSRSAGKTTQMSVLTETADLNAVIDFFSDDPRFSALCLWGESQGGFVAGWAAAGRPHDVDALILFYPAFNIPEIVTAYLPKDTELPESLNVMGTRVGQVYANDALSVDVWAALPAFSSPVLIEHGDRDTLVPITVGEHASQVFPNAVLNVLNGQNHGFSGTGRTQAKADTAAFLLSLFPLSSEQNP